MASKPGRKLGNWRGPAEGRLMLCVLNVLMRQRRDRAFVVGEFKRLVPCYQAFHRNPISDNAIWGRADVGVREGRYATEHPDKAPDLVPYLPTAQRIVVEGASLSEQEMRDIVKRVAEGGPDTAPAEAVADPPPFPELAVPQPEAPPRPTNRATRRETQRRDPALDDPNIVSRLRRHGYDALADEIEAGGEPDLPGLPEDEGEEEDEVATEAPAMAAE